MVEAGESVYSSVVVAEGHGYCSWGEYFDAGEAAGLVFWGGLINDDDIHTSLEKAVEHLKEIVS